MTQQTYTLDARELMIRFIPTELATQPDTQSIAYRERQVKSYKEYADGVIEVLFKEDKPKAPATLQNVAKIGITTIKFSKNRVNLVTSFAKADVDDAFRQLQEHHEEIHQFVVTNMNQAA